MNLRVNVDAEGDRVNCNSCDYFGRTHKTQKHDGSTAYLCDFCYSTLIGNDFLYAKSRELDGATLAQAIHWLLKEIKK